MKRLMAWLFATVFAVQIFFGGSWADFPKLVQTLAKDMKEFVVELTTDKDWWKLWELEKKIVGGSVPTKIIEGAKVIQEGKPTTNI